MPAASCSGLSATTICIVEQFGLATIPLRMSASASGLTSETTSGTSSSIRHFDELSTTIAPAAAKRGAHSPDVDAAGGEDRDVEALDRLVGQRLHDADALQLLAGRALGGERHDLARGEAALAQQPQHRRRRPARSRRRPRRGTSPAGGGQSTHRACSPIGRSCRIASAPSSNARVQRLHRVGDAVAADHARDLDRRGRDHLDVDPLAGEHREHLRGDARVRLHPRADDRDLAHLGLVVDPADPELADDRLERLARDPQILARDGERQLGAFAPLAERLVLDDHVDVAVRLGERLEDARRRTRLVAHADQRDARLLGRVRDGGDEGVLHGLLLSDDECTGAVLEAGTAVDADPVVARVLDRAQLQHLRARGRHLQHLLERDDLELARVGTMRGSAL